MSSSVLTPTTSEVAPRLVALRVCEEALTDIQAWVDHVPDCELSTLLGTLDRVAALAAGGRVAVTAAALRCGVVADSQAASTTAWVAAHAPTQLAEGAGATARVAEVIAGTHPASAEAATQVATAVTTGQVPAGVALAAVTEYTRLRPRLLDHAAPDVLGGLLQVGATGGRRDIARLAPEMLRRFGAPTDLQAEHDALAQRVALSRPRPDGAGTFTYQLTLDPEGRAVLEAAIGPLSRPILGPDQTPDPRDFDQRRGQALVEVCRRVTTAAQSAARWLETATGTSSMGAGDTAAGGGPAAPSRAMGAPDLGELPTGLKATLFLTMTWTDLRDAIGAGRTLGTLDAGDPMAAHTIRRIACDAAIIPTVLGGPSEILDLGTRARLFSPGQQKALWLRDRHCTYPGCTTPAFWTDAHHLHHWADGGPTTLDNAALLCGRHHTIVHRDQLTGQVVAGRVRWNTTVGSYRHRR